MVDSNIIRGPDFKSSTFLSELENTTLDGYIIAAAKRRCRDVFMIDAVSNEQLTTEEFLQRSYGLAAELQELGCTKNTIVGILSENRPEFSISSLATMLTGATLTCLNPFHTVGELKPVFNITKPQIMFCSMENYGKLEQVVPPSTTIIVFDSNTEMDALPYLKFSELIQSVKTYSAVENKPEDTVLVLYSSGTTGLPKGVMLTHKNIVFMLKLACEEMKFNEIPQTVFISVAPMFHASGFMYMFVVLHRDATLIIMRKFDARLFLSNIEKYKINHLLLIPYLVTYLLKSPIVDEYDLSCVQSISCGTAPLKNTAEQALKEKFGLKYVQQLYGLTECMLIATMKGTKNTKPGSCGSVIPGCQMKVVHMQTREILGKNESGEICIKGPHVMKGYYGNEKETAETVDEDGWLHTGDFGFFDEDGDFFIVDRIKEMIKYKSSQVPPAELEALLLTHPAIAECGVIGIPDEDAGELPRGYVVKRVGMEVTENEIVQFVAERISPRKRLWGGVEFVSEIPKNLTGKILRRKLRELWKMKAIPNHETHSNSARTV